MNVFHVVTRRSKNDSQTSPQGLIVFPILFNVLENMQQCGIFVGAPASQKGYAEFFTNTTLLIQSHNLRISAKSRFCKFNQNFGHGCTQNNFLAVLWHSSRYLTYLLGKTHLHNSVAFVQNTLNANEVEMVNLAPLRGLRPLRIFVTYHYTIREVEIWDFCQVMCQAPRCCYNYIRFARQHIKLLFHTFSTVNPDRLQCREVWQFGQYFQRLKGKFSGRRENNCSTWRISCISTAFCYSIQFKQFFQQRNQKSNSLATASSCLNGFSSKQTNVGQPKDIVYGIGATQVSNSPLHMHLNQSKLLAELFSAPESAPIIQQQGCKKACRDQTQNRSFCIPEIPYERSHGRLVRKAPKPWSHSLHFHCRCRCHCPSSFLSLRPFLLKASYSTNSQSILGQEGWKENVSKFIYF